MLPENSVVGEDSDENQKSINQKVTTDDSSEKEKLDIICHSPPSLNDNHHQHHHLAAICRLHERDVDSRGIEQLLHGFVDRSPPSSKVSLRSIETALGPRLVYLKKLVFASLPYLAFLASFALNAYLRILPTADDAQIVTLYNVSQWESYVLPCSVDRMIASVHHPLLDLLAALPYLAHYVLPLAYPVYLHLSGRSDLIPQFFKLLGWTMWVHYAIWFCLPTFPPWAVLNSTAGQENVNFTPALNLSTKEGRAFSRVDQLLHWPLFHNLFSGNPVPFASFPSGHVAWPTCIFVTLPPGGPITFAIYIALMSWATMYSDHHYILDALVAVLVVSSTKKLISYIDKSTPASSELGGILVKIRVTGSNPTRGDHDVGTLDKFLSTP